jgi:formylmethanofuran dehydrogenase subunit E
MNINNLTPEYINKKRYRSLAASRRKLYPKPGSAWIQGWDAAIRFAKQVEISNYICEHCGKLLTNDIRFDAEFTPFCPKCYDKLFKKGAKDE